jgi:hypothetical protein
MITGRRYDMTFPSVGENKTETFFFLEKVDDIKSHGKREFVSFHERSQKIDYFFQTVLVHGATFSLLQIVDTTKIS